MMPPSAAPPTRTSEPARQPTPPAWDDGHASPTPTHGSRSRSRRLHPQPVPGPSSPFPSIRAADEEDFFAALDKSEKEIPNVNAGPAAWSRKVKEASQKALTGIVDGDGGDLPPQTVLARVIGELEADFAHYKS